MPGIIVSDTSSLIILNKIGRLDLLKSLFGQIAITRIVSKEFNNPLPDFINIQDPKDNNYQKILESFLDKGEASAIALALEIKDCLLIIDELKGRREAKNLGISYTGIMGILIIAKEKNIINSVSAIIDDIQKTDFRLSQKLIEETKRRSGE